jgi:thiamine biosynthesis lipoprotein
MNVFYDSFLAMGTRFEIVLPGVDDAYGHMLSREVEDEVIRLDKKLSRFSPKSLVRRLNVEAYDHAVFLDAEMWSLFSLCFDYYHLTHGAFDIAILPLLELWGFGQMETRKWVKPSATDVDACLKHVGMQYVALNEKERSIRFMKSGVQIDLGAIGKGYALEEVKGILQAEGIENAFVNFGGSSILALGSHPYGDCWRVGVQHPEQAGETLYEWELMDSAISTSGVANKFVAIDGEQYGHILHPKFGYPVDDTGLISVCASSAIEAEVLSTSFFVLDASQRQAVLGQTSGVRIAEIPIGEQV